MNKKEFEKLIKSYQGIDNTINDLYHYTFSGKEEKNEI